MVENESVPGAFFDTLGERGDDESAYHTITLAKDNNTPQRRGSQHPGKNQPELVAMERLVILLRCEVECINDGVQQCMPWHYCCAASNKPSSVA